MCVTSMVMDHYTEKWQRPPYTIPVWFPTLHPIEAPRVSQKEIEEFRELLERAREYDRKMKQPDCELVDKKELLRRLAKELGVELSFL